MGSVAQVAVDEAESTMTVPVKGFPAGWRLRPGDRVFLRETAGKKQATPWVRPVEGVIEGQPTAGRSLKMAGQNVVIGEETVVVGGADRSDASVAYVADCIENVRGRPLSCVALKPRRSS
ncbi:MAG: hypothetical protein GEV03_08270 [Streptosporangiales bacterium]|nr:hypothetical protein [Streptosporangiales bacterium]